MMVPIQSHENCSPGVYAKKNLLGMRPTEYAQYCFSCWLRLRVPAWRFFFFFFSQLKESFKTSMDQKVIIERVIIDLVCCSRCPVNGFTDVSFYNGGLEKKKCFSPQYCKWPVGNIGSKAERRHPCLNNTFKVKLRQHWILHFPTCKADVNTHLVWTRQPGFFYP